MDLAALDAIDVHVHVEQDSHGCAAELYEGTTGAAPTCVCAMTGMITR